jgi:hypothetical protein
MLFRDTLSEKTTTMYTSTNARINNISLAAAAINGTILNPGETFSFNGVVGKRTAEKGYQYAGAYVGGQDVPQIGGGICQCSSTVYYCALKANCEIVSRSNHMFAIAYLPLSLDATVDWGNIDFKFKNSRDYPIRIDAGVTGKELTVEIWGTNSTGEYVELQSVCLETIPFETVEEIDETLAPGQQEKKVSGHTGYISEAYKLLYAADGTLISKTKISHDVYKAGNKIIRVGPTPEDQPVDGGTTTDPTPTPGPDNGGTTEPAPTPGPDDGGTADPTPAPGPDDGGTAEPDPTPTPDPGTGGGEGSGDSGDYADDTAEGYGDGEGTEPAPAEGGGN